MNENISKYLAENKGKYSKEALEEALLNAGYQKNDIEKSINLIYGIKSDAKNIHPSKGFWDFSGKKEYVESSDKLVDFLLGVVASVSIAVVSDLIFGIGIMLFFLINIILLVYFSNRRTFIVAGLALGFVLGPIVGEFISEISDGFSLHNSLFF